MWYGSVFLNCWNIVFFLIGVMKCWFVVEFKRFVLIMIVVNYFCYKYLIKISIVF